jgi:chromosome segregation ATPase
MDNTEQKPLTEKEKIIRKHIELASIANGGGPLTDEDFEYGNREGANAIIIAIMDEYASQQTEQLTSYFEKVHANKVRILEDKHKEQTEQLQAEIKSLHETIESGIAVYKDDCKDLRDQITELRSELSIWQNLDLMEEIKEKEEKIKSLEQEKEALQKEKLLLEMSVEDQHRSLVDKNAKIQSLTEASAADKAEIDRQSGIAYGITQGYLKLQADVKSSKPNV